MFFPRRGVAGSAGTVAGRGVGEDHNDGAVDKQVSARTRIAEPDNISGAGLVRA